MLSIKNSTNVFIHGFIINFAAVFWHCASTFGSAFYTFAKGLEAQRIYLFFKRIWEVTLDSWHTLRTLSSMYTISSSPPFHMCNLYRFNWTQFCNFAFTWSNENYGRMSSNDASFLMRTWLIQIHQMLLLYPAYSENGYIRNSKELLLLPDQELQEGAWHLLFAMNEPNGLWTLLCKWPANATTTTIFSSAFSLIPSDDSE